MASLFSNLNLPMTKLKYKNLRVMSTTTLALFLIFQPIPLGLGKFELVISSIIGFIILLINKQIIIKKFFLLLLTFLVSILGVTNSVLSYELRFDIYQAARALIPTYIFFVILFSKIKSSFFEKIEKFLPFLIFCSLINVLLFYSGTSLYNASLELKLEETTRFYVHGYPFFFLSFIIALANLRISILPYSLMLIVTQSKTFIIELLLLFPLIFIYKNSSKKKLFSFFILLIFIFIIFIYTKDRIHTFIEHGDTHRLMEINAFISAILNDPVRLLIGNGPGIPYRDFSTEDIYNNSIGIINAMHDIHFHFLKLCLFFGVPLTFILTIFFYKSLLFKNFFFQIILTFFFIISGNFDIYGAIGIRYLVYKFK